MHSVEKGKLDKAAVVTEEPLLTFVTTDVTVSSASRSGIVTNDMRGEEFTFTRTLAE